MPTHRHRAHRSQPARDHRSSDRRAPQLGRRGVEADGDAAGEQRRDPSDQAWVVEREQTGIPLDRFLEQTFPDFDRKELRRLMRDGKVCVDGLPETTSRPLHKHAVVTFLRGSELGLFRPREEGASLPVLYEDSDVAAVAKPAGVASDPQALDDTFPGWRAALREPNGREPLRCVDKAERDASGVQLLAKNLETAKRLRDEWLRGEISLEDFVIVDGSPEQDAFDVDFPLGADARRTGHRVVDLEHGDAARTRFEVVRRFDGFTEMRARPLTRRTHQVRAHLEAAGYPISVDAMYGGRAELCLSDIKRGFQEKAGRREKPLIARITLHRASMTFRDASRAAVTVEAPIPDDLARLQRSLEHYREYRNPKSTL